MRRRVSGKTQILPPLSDDLVHDCRGNTVAAKAADGQIVAVVRQASDGILDGSELVRQGARFARKISARVVGGWIREEFTIALGENIHVAGLMVSDFRSRAATAENAGHDEWRRDHGPHACSGSRGSRAPRPCATSAAPDRSA